MIRVDARCVVAKVRRRWMTLRSRCCGESGHGPLAAPRRAEGGPALAEDGHLHLLERRQPVGKQLLQHVPGIVRLPGKDVSAGLKVQADSVCWLSIA